MRWSHVAVLALVQLVTASPLAKRWGDLQVKHAWEEVPRGWVLHGEAPADHKLKLRVGLKQDRFDELVEHLYQVSDPAHERYGAHLSKEEVDALVAPHPETVSLVESWCGHHGIDSSTIEHSQAGDWLSMTVTVEQAEEMLGTKYNVYRNPETDSYVVRTTEYSLPTILYDHVSVVAPTTYFGNMRKMKSMMFLQPNLPTISDEEASEQAQNPPTTVPLSCNTTITPTCLRTLYKTIDYVPKAAGKNKIGVDGYLEEFASESDLQVFLQTFRPDAVGATFPVVEVNGGGNNQSNPGGEANLDTQTTEGLTFPTPNIYFSTGGSPPFIPNADNPTDTNEPYLNWLEFILDQEDIPQTFSTSYGDEESTVPFDYATTVCNLFAQLGVRGSSVLFASGDGGVGGDCVPDAHNITLFTPGFPASCPFVTAVGATFQIEPEISTDFSGGGFSNYFARPSYQDAAVTGFLKGLGKTNAGAFNPNGRGYPDVSAQGLGFQIVFEGEVFSVGGTSASTPTFSGVVTLLNDFRIANGKSPLGFLNPLIYSSLAAGLNDITIGSNPGCGTPGFNAGPGWDPVTGFGTPDFVKLQGIVANL